MELPVPVVRAVPSADGSAAEPCARSDDAAAAAKVASRAQTEHAEHLQGLLRALQLPGGAAVAQPQHMMRGTQFGAKRVPIVCVLLNEVREQHGAVERLAMRAEIAEKHGVSPDKLPPVEYIMKHTPRMNGAATPRAVQGWVMVRK